MIKIRKSNERGHFNHGWLDTRHSFSFGDYFDAEHMGFRTLRVINEDVIQPGQGFGTHSHRDMEILTLVTEGALEHKDSLGNASMIKPGEIQRMTAGRGVTHSEFNSSKKNPVHLLQIWILPDRKDLQPGYEQRVLKSAGKESRLRLIASPEGENDSVKIHQKAFVYDGALRGNETLSHGLPAKQGAWIQVVNGVLELNHERLEMGDGAAVEKEPKLIFQSKTGAEFLLFNLA